MLARIVPGATGFSPDQIPGLAMDRWQSFPIDDRNPSDVTIEFVEYCLSRVNGLLIIITSASLATGAGPFFIDGDQFTDFAMTYHDLIGEPLIDGDTTVVSPSTGRVIVVHHDGWIDTLQGHPQGQDV
ncbi:hypothetical protein [Thermomonospora umbrina]|uniref:Uncharacterized protein n=1 Tax=Thermomonospora umbrina TaxID=111806 RepID=A0A3D9T2N7_9ACTN|nr:hypothetical protein [Thermomonospora umbrina]REF00624.1 hypothetical protein DFJ69_6180 [Thermomonospora umbrina]